MDLYIRSQNKRGLEKMGKLWIECDDYDEKPDSRYSIYNDESIIATFKTEKRALEVLDDIHNILKGNWVAKNVSLDYVYPVIIYKIPKE